MHVALQPFESVIAERIEEVVSRIPLKPRYNPSSVKAPSVTACLREPLKIHPFRFYYVYTNFII